MPDLFSIDLDAWGWFLFLVAGVFTGIINTLAGSGSLITLPLFIFICGLPAPVANGTNRIGVLFQSWVGLRGFHQTGLTDYNGATWLVVPTLIGAVVGALIAVDLNEQLMNQVIGLLMVFMLGVLLINPKRWLQESTAEPNRNRHPATMLVFFLIGVYGGFIQAGVGVFLLAGLVLVSRYSLGSGNGVKLLIVFCFGIPALAIFFFYNQVHVGFGLAMAVFQAIGAWMAVRFVARVPNANVWIHRLLIVIVAVSALKMFGLF